ncbi:MAG: RNA 2'-phosphotransferase [Oscillospiraceae bacterium]|nr:RNA 2'-phosphotransferase [Oscillospiraceae bacterium]
MKKIDDVKTGRFISLVLRHDPSAAGIKLDRNGYGDVAGLIRGVSKKYPGFSMEDLERIVENNNKQRYAFNEDKTKIRARQGHSTPGIDLGLTASIPPELLYHGTSEASAAAIKNEGIKKMSRHMVHLSADIQTAEKVGARHGKPYIFTIRSGEMHRDGFEFFLSENGVWLTEFVPPEYLFEE